MILAKSVTTPFGSRPLVFADFIASGRPLQCVETAIQEHVLPYYSNTHTETGLLGRLMTDLSQDARNTIKRQCHADPNEYACLFLGSGSTSALNRVACLLDLKSPTNSVVFVSSAEHHSNLLIWREMGMKVVSIPTVLATGCIDLTLLEESLAEHSTYSNLIGSFTAASNIVGILQPVHKIARLMHKYNGLALFDYACAAPYVAIEMSPSHLDPLEHLDAVMISPHKFIGGPGTPGILIIRKRICRMGAAPVSPGGGAVAWVNGWGYHAYVQDFETREEAGTPDVIGCIRAGLAFHIKALLTPAYITSKCLDLTRYAMQQLSKAPNITILGPPSFSMDSKADSVHYSKLPIFSILVQGPSLCGKGKLLHFNYVSKLLTDVFGIQTRGGCSCASPYFMELSQVTAQEELQRRNAYLPDATSNLTKEGMKPGFTRFNLSYTHSKAEVDYILGAVKWVSEHGWKLLTYMNMIG
ncbi:pyridoxal phosphate-dependent transferase [Obelidium mucronatum]|nr:pyridoxal phosphate-dependent transferase [Obelidium mucronatum]